MKLSRIASAIAVAAMAPAVMLSSPAFAADAASPSTPSAPTVPDQGSEGDKPTGDAGQTPAEDSQATKDRAAIQAILTDPASGPGVREAAEKALKGTAA
ncbi:hypothetical protein [Streptomyces sp. NPDC051567]|uniref:hypothetical protein n=1 Tax=Streptomyces sp. NPDC051567 TaxID=3365660 RepID=UPI003791F12E